MIILHSLVFLVFFPEAEQKYKYWILDELGIVSPVHKFRFIILLEIPETH